MGGVPSWIIHVAVRRVVYPPKGCVNLILHKLFIIFRGSFSRGSTFFFKQKKKI